MKYQVICNKWLESQNNYIKESSYCTYKFNVQKHIIPKIGNKEITNDILQQFINQKAINGNLINNTPLSEKTLKELILINKQIIKFGIEMQLIKPFAIKIRVPSDNEKLKKMPLFTHEELVTLKSYCIASKQNINLGILICMYTGIRIGELCALTWDDIDFVDNTMLVNKTIQKLYLGNNKSKVVITNPKSVNANRMIPLNSELIELLKLNKNTSKYIISDSDKPVLPCKFRNHYYKVLVDNYIDKKPVHALRHTFATTCINLGTDYKVVSELLGHASVKTTIDIYQHINTKAKYNCIQQLKF